MYCNVGAKAVFHSFKKYEMMYNMDLIGAARKKSVEENNSRGDDSTLSPTRKTRISPRRAQGNSPRSHDYCKTRRSRPTDENPESNHASDDESHNETKVNPKLDLVSELLLIDQT